MGRLAALVLATIGIGMGWAVAAEPAGSEPASAGLSLWVETPGTMILADRPAGAAKEIVLAGVRNEYVSAQLGLRSGQEAEKPFTFEWTALAGPGGKEIPKGKVELFRAADIVVDHGSNESKSKNALRVRPKGSFPDALVPLILADGTNVANSIKPEKDKTIAFWVDVFIPAGTPAGQYSGGITLNGGEKPLTIPVKLKVADAEIPAESTIPSMYNLRDWPHVRANIDNYVAVVMAHRFQPTNYHYYDMQQDFLDHYNPNGKGYVSVLISDTAKPSEARAKQVADYLKKTEAHLKQRGLWDRTFLQLKDEPDPGELPGITEFVKQALADSPDWKGKVAETLSSKEGTELDQYVTHHVRPLALYDSWSWRKMDGREEWDKRRQAGQQLWFYFSNSQGTPYPTLDVNTPSVAFESRVAAWGFWYEKAVGHLYWDLMFVPGWKLHPRFPPGDGQLIYPGDFTMEGAPAWVLVKDIKQPVVSRRLKIFRQGLQEWEMLRLAEKKVGREKVQAIVTPIYTALGNSQKPNENTWSTDEADWDKARAAVISLLEERP